MQTDSKPDIGNAKPRQPEEMPQNVQKGQPRCVCSRGRGGKSRQWPGDEHCVKEEEESGEPQANDSQACNASPAITVEQDGESQPEKGNQVKDGERQRDSLYQLSG